MELTSDVEQWPGSPLARLRGVGALHLTDRELTPVLWSRIVEGCFTNFQFYDLFLLTEDDKQVNLVRPFWLRNQLVAAQKPHWEARYVDEGQITRVGLLERDGIDLRSSLYRAGLPHQLRLALAGPTSIDIDAFAQAIAADLPRLEVNFATQGMVLWLLRSGLRRKIIVIRPEDDLTGRSGLGFYGGRQQIESVYEVVAADLHNKATDNKPFQN
jgi:hypothetical protein